MLPTIEFGSLDTNKWTLPETSLHPCTMLILKVVQHKIQVHKIQQTQTCWCYPSGSILSQKNNTNTLNSGSIFVSPASGGACNPGAQWSRDVRGRLLWCRSQEFVKCSKTCALLNTSVNLLNLVDFSVPFRFQLIAWFTIFCWPSGRAQQVGFFNVGSGRVLEKTPCSG